jgi:hypothetical protein
MGAASIAISFVRAEDIVPSLPARDWLERSLSSQSADGSPRRTHCFSPKLLDELSRNIPVGSG